MQKYFQASLTALLITLLNSTTTLAGVAPPPVAGTNVVENFTLPRNFTDGMKLGKCNALTVETAGGPSLSIVNNSYLLGTSPVKSDGFIIRSTKKLPATYKLTVDMGDIDFDLTNRSDFENGVYLPTISPVAGAPGLNDWWHLNRKVHIDIDNNIWGSGGVHPVFFGYYNPSSLTEPDPANGQLVYNQATSAWVEINSNWASAFNYQKNTWYTFEIEKTATTYFFRIYDALSHALLREAFIPVSSVRSGNDFLAIGDPHTNYYKGSVKIANLRITNINCSGGPIISSFTANPTTITAGGSSILSWATSGETSLHISGVGTVIGSSFTVNPTTTTTYILTAANSSGSITAAATVTVDGSTSEKIYLEAENAAGIVLPLRVASHVDASNQKFIYVPNLTGDALQPGSVMATYPVNIVQGGDYILWGRVIAPNSNNDSFFVQIDDGPNHIWDVQDTKIWLWDQVNSQTIPTDPVKFTLTPGTHTIKIKLREDGTRLDRLFLTNDVNSNP